LRKQYGDAVWSDEQSPMLHRLPMLAEDGRKTVWVSNSSGGVVDAREASDLIAKLSGKSYWRKLFVERERVDVAEARRICRAIVREGR